MLSDLVDLITAGAGFIALLTALWHKLRAERYRQRWRGAMNLNGVDGTSDVWEVQLDTSGRKPQWSVTNGACVAVKLDADFEYPSLAERSRQTAHNLASELNRGMLKVAS